MIHRLPITQTPLRLCWWEADELLDHLQSRPKLWVQSPDNPDLWIREDKDTLAFSVLFVGTPATGRFRTTLLHTTSGTWSPDDVVTYLTWLVSHWTTYTQRITVTSFLQDELGIPSETAVLAAIAIEGLSREAREAPEPPSPLLQEELWPEEHLPSNLSFDQDPTLLGTFLFSGSSGWLQLRLTGGQIRATLALKSKHSSSVIPLQGFLRPLNGRVRDAAAEIAGWSLDVVPMDPTENPSLSETSE